jgi:hypothetical protein
VTGVALPPDFTTFWNQALQRGLKPEVASIGKVLLFPAAVQPLGPKWQQSILRSLMVDPSPPSSRRSMACQPNTWLMPINTPAANHGRGVRQRLPKRRDTTKPAIFDLYQQVADVVSPPAVC